MIVSGWVHRHPLIVVEFVQAENRLLKEKLGGKRIRFTDAERALLARKAKAVGRKALLELDTIVAPDTLLRWHRRLVAEKWNFAHRRGAGRPGIMRELSELIVRMASDNSGWGYTRIQGALANLGHKVGRGTVANVLNRNGIEPAPERSKRRGGNVSQGALENFCGERFSDRGGLNGQGAGHTLFVVHDQPGRPGGRSSRIDGESGQGVDLAGRAQRHRLRRRSSARQTLLDYRPGYKIHGAIPAISARVWDRGDPVATHVAEFERIRRALRTLDQGGMPESDDFRRAGVAARCGVAIHRALSRRTEPPGTGQQANPTLLG